MKLVKPGTYYRGMRLGDWVVVKASPKTITVASASARDPGARFAGKRYQFKWDGKGYKRSGSYLSTAGTVKVGSGLGAAWARHPRYRCTRNKGNEGVPVTDRKGYIAHATSRTEAIRAMGKRFKNDKDGFTCQLASK